MSEELTLYDINTELLRLFHEREDTSVSLRKQGAADEEIDAALELVDMSIRAHIEAQIKKGDGIAYYLREFEARQKLEKLEAERVAARAKKWEQRKKRLEEITIAVMQATGYDRIEGAHNTLVIKKNPPSVDPKVNLNLVPESLLRREITVTENIYQKLLENKVEVLKAVAPEPIKSEILKKLKAGEAVAGCNLKTDSVRLEVE